MNATTMPDAATLIEVEQLLYREAYLLDQHRFDDWLALFTDDALYWAPLEENQRNGQDTSSIIHDDREMMALRVRQYRDARAHARLPLARTVHQVSNVLIVETGATELVVASALVLIEYRQERQRVFGASVTHTLRHAPQGLRIATKRVDLVNSESELDGIAFLL